MVEKSCNIWLEKADFRCILTSGALTPDGSAVFDNPLALEAAKKFQGLESDLGRMIASRGNHANLVRPGLVAFPIKQFQYSAPNLQMITRSARELMEIVGEAKTLLPRPGVTPGGLTWEQVSQAISFLPDNIIIVDHTG